MARLINAKLNLSKINKKRIFTSDKGVHYLDIIIMETPNGKYGDWLIVESVKKEERENGIKGNILGNGKNFGVGTTTAPDTYGSGASNDMPQTADDLPF